MAWTRKGLLKKLALAVVVPCLFFVALEAVLALVGVRPTVFEEDPYLGFSSWSPLFVEDPAAGRPGVMVTAPNKLRLFNVQRFARQKPAGVVRVFCLGGSTTYGRPYDDATSFCGWMRELLPAADPTRQWELINAGGISYASYRVATLMEELVEYQPDIFVVYSGHNEFLEARTYSRIINMPKPLRGLGALAARTRTHAVMNTLLRPDARSAQGASPGDSEPLLDEDVVTRLDSSVGPEAYSRDDEQRDRTLEHYQFNLARMADIANSAGAAMVLVAPASNLRDCTPFKSQHRAGLDGEGLARWQQLIVSSREALRAGDSATAVAGLDEAIALDPRHAHTQFLRAKVLDSLGRTEEAKAAYERARDEDVCPLRALSPVRDMVARVAAERGAVFVDFPAVVANKTKDGIAGNDLFLDHVHPTIGANRLLALSVTGAMHDAGLISFDAGWTAARAAEIARRVEAGLDRTDHGAALTKLSKVLGWAGKLEEAHTLALRAVQLVPDDVGAQYQAGLTADLLGLVDESIRHYQKAVELDPTADLPHGNLAVALEKKGDLRGALPHYRVAYANAAPTNVARSRDNLAMGLAKLGTQDLAADNIDAAVQALKEARQLSPRDWRVLTQLAEALLAAGDVEGAKAALRQAVVERPDDARLHNRLAVLLAEAGDIEGAAAAFGRALAIDPAIADRPESLTQRLERAGRLDEIRAIRTALAP